MQCAYAILSSVSCSHLQYFSTLPHKRQDLRKKGKKKLLNIKCVRIFSTILTETFLALRRIQRDIITNVHRSPCEVPIILVRLQRNLIFLNRYSKKNTQISNFKKIRPEEAELFHADRQTDGRTRRS